MNIFLHPCFNMEPTSIFGASYFPGCSLILPSPDLAYLKKGSKLQTNHGNRAPHPLKKTPNKNTTKKATQTQNPKPL